MQNPDVHIQVSVKIIEQSLVIVHSLKKNEKYYHFHILVFRHNVKTVKRKRIENIRFRVDTHAL